MNIWKQILTLYTENPKDQDDNVGSQDRSWRKKLQGGSREQRQAGSFTQTETRTVGSISDCEEWKTLNPDPSKKLVGKKNNSTFSLNVMISQVDSVITKPIQTLFTRQCLYKAQTFPDLAGAGLALTVCF